MQYTIHCVRTISESVVVEADTPEGALKAFGEREDDDTLCHSCAGNEFGGDDFSRNMDGELIAQRVEDESGREVWKADSR